MVNFDLSQFIVPSRPTHSSPAQPRASIFRPSTWARRATTRSRPFTPTPLPTLPRGSVLTQRQQYLAPLPTHLEAPVRRARPCLLSDDSVWAPSFFARPPCLEDDSQEGSPTPLWQRLCTFSKTCMHFIVWLVLLLWVFLKDTIPAYVTACAAWFKSLRKSQSTNSKTGTQPVFHQQPAETQTQLPHFISWALLILSSSNPAAGEIHVDVKEHDPDNAYVEGDISIDDHSQVAQVAEWARKAGVTRDSGCACSVRQTCEGEAHTRTVRIFDETGGVLKTVVAGRTDTPLEIAVPNGTNYRIKVILHEELYQSIQRLRKEQTHAQRHNSKTHADRLNTVISSIEAATDYLCETGVRTLALLDYCYFPELSYDGLGAVFVAERASDNKIVQVMILCTQQSGTQSAHAHVLASNHKHVASAYSCTGIPEKNTTVIISEL